MVAGVALASATQPPAPAPPTPSQALAAAFQNVQTLRTLNATQLHDSMVFMTAALGTTCEACQVRAADGQVAFEKDDKRNKVTDWARTSTMKSADIAVNPALDEGRFVKPVAENP
jgi:hypothetical protein